MQAARARSESVMPKKTRLTRNAVAVRATASPAALCKLTPRATILRAQGNLLELSQLLTEPESAELLCAVDAMGYTPTQRAYECWRLTKDELYLSSLRLLFTVLMLQEAHDNGSVDSAAFAPGVPYGAVPIPDERAILTSHAHELFGTGTLDPFVAPPAFGKARGPKTEASLSLDPTSAAVEMVSLRRNVTLDCYSSRCNRRVVTVGCNRRGITVEV